MVIPMSLIRKQAWRGGGEDEEGVPKAHVSNVLRLCDSR